MEDDAIKKERAFESAQARDPWLRADVAEMNLRVETARSVKYFDHLNDIYRMLGLTWGDDPFPVLRERGKVEWADHMAVIRQRDELEARCKRLEEHARAIYRALGLEASPDVDPFPTIAALRLAGRRYALAVEKGDVKEVDGRLTYFEPGRSETLLAGEPA